MRTWRHIHNVWCDIPLKFFSSWWYTTVPKKDGKMGFMAMKCLYSSYPTFSDVICNLPHPHTTSKCVYLDTHFSIFFYFICGQNWPILGFMGQKSTIYALFLIRWFFASMCRLRVIYTWKFRIWPFVKGNNFQKVFADMQAHLRLKFRYSSFVYHE